MNTQKKGEEVKQQATTTVRHRKREVFAVWRIEYASNSRRRISHQIFAGLRSNMERARLNIIARLEKKGHKVKAYLEFAIETWNAKLIKHILAKCCTAVEFEQTHMILTAKDIHWLQDKIHQVEARLNVVVDDMEELFTEDEGARTEDESEEEY